jgi:secreted PhoX family phosphatase
MTQTDRRNFLRHSLKLTGGALIAPSLAGLVACNTEDALTPGAPRLRQAPAGAGGYGMLKESKDYPEISIPPGFHALRIDRTGDVLSDGNILRNAFDGMGAFGVAANRVRLVRNHEMRDAAGRYAPLSPINAYDGKANGGNTTVELEVRPDGAVELVKHFVSLSGTFTNCAGGVTPWGSWLSAEEAVEGPSRGFEKNHGYIFEIPATADGPVEPVPLKAMGRFVHEAIAIDPTTGIVYETEDRGTSGFYRFIPDVPGQLARGGRLQMLAIRGRPNYDTRKAQRPGERFACTWVDIDQPDSDLPNMDSLFVFNQGWAKGGAVFARLEGAWWGDNSVYFVATSGGDANMGQIFRYIPTPSGGELALVFESPSKDVLNMPDNINISPRGGIVLCEDGEGTNFVRGLTRDGAVFDVVRNNINTAEWAGACWAPQGRTLFVNLQGATAQASTTWGATYAIWGPWESGAL